MTGFTQSERVALDRATVPPMRAGLAGDIVAAARSGAALPRRRARGGWRRHGRVLLGAGALVIASATAAATGLLDRLPIRIPGITRVAEAEPPKPRHVVRVEKPRAAPGQTVSLAPLPMPVVPLVDPTPAPAGQWRERRAARIAAGLPVGRPLLQRAMAERLRGMPPAERRAAMIEWRRIKALPPAERKLAVARLRADYLARHPKMAARYEAQLEAKSAAAATGADPAMPRATPPMAPADPVAGLHLRPRPDERQGERPGFGGGLRPDGTPRPALTPKQRAQRQQWRQWRMERRAQRLGNDAGRLGGRRWRERPPSVER